MAYEDDYQTYLRECAAEGIEADTFEDFQSEMLCAQEDRDLEFSFFHGSRA
jgi:hypothetical protein